MTLKQALGKMKWKNFFFLTVAGMVNAFGVTMFIAPVDLYDSGISGTSILLSQLTPEWLSLSLFLLVLNIPLFLYGLKKQGVTPAFLRNGCNDLLLCNRRNFDFYIQYH